MHEGLASCSEFARLLAIALLNWSDDEGYFMANPILIRGQVFPFLDDSKIIPRSLQDLSRVGWIQLGKDDQGRDVGMVKNFAKHQRVDKPKPSSIKGNFRIQDQSKINPRSIQDQSKEEGNGMEWKGRELLSASADERYPLIIETIWLMFPPMSRNRSSKSKLAKAWNATRPKPPEEKLLPAIVKWCVSHEWTKDGGQFAPGAHIWVKDRKWESEPLATVAGKSTGMSVNEMGLS